LFLSLEEWCESLSREEEVSMVLSAALSAFAVLATEINKKLKTKKKLPVRRSVGDQALLLC
jgi:hypothetical protein